MHGWYMERSYVFFYLQKQTVLLAYIFAFNYSAVSVMRNVRLQAHTGSYLTPP